MSTLRCLSPIDGRLVAERPLATETAIAAALARAEAAKPAWRATAVALRVRLLELAVDRLLEQKDEIAREITLQMGRPIAQSPGELRGFEERARHMLGIAGESLADLDVGAKEGFRRFVRKEPLGLVLVIAPWNYPWLTAVNAIWPALAAGNTVILKHSAQTPLVAERFQEALDAAGLPAGVFQHLHLSHESALQIVQAPEVAMVAFTGSVPGGHAVQQAAAGRFIATNLELGGKDPAYVRHDADLAHAIENLVDGACFNSGQSCCGIERIYVHTRLYDDFVEGAASLMAKYRLDDPLDPATTLGPMVRASAADHVRGQIKEALGRQARAHVDPKAFAREAPGSAYCAPQLLTGVDHSMRIMREETFGPVVGVMKVDSDDEAVRLMNDSRYGLTAAIWTSDPEAAIAIGDRIDTGTWFMNRCDYLDPALAWTGVKDSGRGVALSRLAYEHLTRPKSFHLRLRTA